MAAWSSMQALACVCRHCRDDSVTMEGAANSSTARPADGPHGVGGLRVSQACLCVSAGAEPLPRRCAQAVVVDASAAGPVAVMAAAPGAAPAIARISRL